MTLRALTVVQSATTNRRAVSDEDSGALTSISGILFICAIAPSLVLVSFIGQSDLNKSINMFLFWSRHNANQKKLCVNKLRPVTPRASMEQVDAWFSAYASMTWIFSIRTTKVVGDCSLVIV
jgi:hypothetical protein